MLHMISFSTSISLGVKAAAFQNSYRYLKVDILLGSHMYFVYYTYVLMLYLCCFFCFILFLALFRSFTSTPTLHSCWLYSSFPLPYFCGNLLDISNIILSYTRIAKVHDYFICRFQFTSFGIESIIYLL